MKLTARGDWEFLWRFLAIALLFEVCWAIWIAMQISTPPIALPAAYEAAAKARAKRNVEGQIRRADAIPPAVAAPAGNTASPVDVGRLKLSESIGSALPEAPADGSGQRPQ